MFEELVGSVGVGESEGIGVPAEFPGGFECDVAEEDDFGDERGEFEVGAGLGSAVYGAEPFFDVAW